LTRFVDVEWPDQQFKMDEWLLVGQAIEENEAAGSPDRRRGHGEHTQVDVGTVDDLFKADKDEQFLALLVRSACHATPPVDLGQRHALLARFDAGDLRLRPAKLPGDLGLAQSGDRPEPAQRAPETFALAGGSECTHA